MGAQYKTNCAAKSIAKTMFGKLKDLAEMKKQASQMRATLAQEQVEVENHGIKIVMSGNQEVISVKINHELTSEDQEKYLKEAFNEAVKKVQRLMAQKMMGNFGM